MLVVSFAWIAFVELTPASKRPYVGSSTNNTELGLTFAYNGFGRVEGQAGGPGQVVSACPARTCPLRANAPSMPPPASRARSRHSSPGIRAAAGTAAPLRLERRSGVNAAHEPDPRSSRSSPRPGKEPDPIRRAPRPLRLFGVGLGDQAGWMLPFAFFGLLGVALLVLLDRRREEQHEERPALTRNPAVAGRSAAIRSRGGRAGSDARAGRVVPGGGRGAEPVQGHRPPLLRLGAGARHGSDGGSGRGCLRRARARDRAGSWASR